VQGFTRQALGLVLGLILVFSFFYGFVVSDYIEWLRFSSPHVPDQATGQVVYMKMAKGVFFATRAQYKLFQSTLFAGLCSISAIVLIKMLKLEDRHRVYALHKSSSVIRYVGLFIISCALIIIFFFGDHLMQLIFSSSLNLPPENRKMIPLQFIPLR
jgi:hypothetical protein